MDFITELPRVDSHDAILVIVDRFSKYVIFFPTRTDCKAEEIAELFLWQVIKLWGIPWNIISYRESCFTICF